MVRFVNLTVQPASPRPGTFYFFLSFQDYLVPSAFITGGFRMGADNQWDRDIPSISVDRFGHLPLEAPCMNKAAMFTKLTEYFFLSFFSIT